MNAENEIEILLVEDNPHDAELALRALKKRHLANRLMWVKDGAEALAVLFPEETGSITKRHPRLRVILLDLKLPKVDGQEVLRRLKNDEQNRWIPVVVLTSSREEQDVVKSYRLGVNSYIVKPVDFEQFSAAVTELGMYWMLLNELPGRAPQRETDNPQTL